LRPFVGKGKRRKREPLARSFGTILWRDPLAVAFPAADDYSPDVPVSRMTRQATFEGDTDDRIVL
jgi:hypothetical protein